MIRICLAASMGLAVAGCNEGNGSRTATTVHKLSVSHHSKVKFANGDADNALKLASVIYATDSDAGGSADVACDVRIERSGDVSLFASQSTPAVINNSNSLDDVFAEKAFTKVVSAINWCSDAGSYAGCALPGPSMIVISGPSLPGQVWGHEFGHNSKLPHRGTVADLMYEDVLTAASVRVNRAECTALVTGARAAAAPSKPLPAAGSSPGSGHQLLAMARSVFVDRIPFATIARQDPAQLPSVIALLRDPKQQQHWQNAATIIGIVGGPQDGDELMRLVDGMGTALDADLRIRIQTAALLALGYLANRHRNREILQFLAARAGAAHWRALAREAAPDADTTRYLREAALLGLALSGQPEALPHLAVDSAIARDLAPGDDLRRTHDEIRRRGLQGYYSE